MKAFERTSRGRGTLDRERIVSAALSWIDDAGVASLSMRRLGQELGVEAMSLYRYVSGREDLLEAVVDRLLSGVFERLESQSFTSWQGYLQCFAHDVRRLAVDHPNAFPLVATRHPAAPWLRPPLRSVQLVEHFLSTLTGRGLTDAQAVAAYRAFTSFLVGALLLEAAARGSGTTAEGEPLDEGDATVPERDGRLDLVQAPTVLRLSGMLSEDHSDAEFEIGLETLLDRLEKAVSQ